MIDLIIMPSLYDKAVEIVDTDRFNTTLKGGSLYRHILSAYREVANEEIAEGAEPIKNGILQVVAHNPYPGCYWHTEYFFFIISDDERIIDITTVWAHKYLNPDELRRIDTEDVSVFVNYHDEDGIEMLSDGIGADFLPNLYALLSELNVPFSWVCDEAGRTTDEPFARTFRGNGGVGVTTDELLSEKGFWMRYVMPIGYEDYGFDSAIPYKDCLQRFDTGTGKLTGEWYPKYDTNLPQVDVEIDGEELTVLIDPNDLFVYVDLETGKVTLDIDAMRTHIRYNVIMAKQETLFGDNPYARYAKDGDDEPAD